MTIEVQGVPDGENIIITLLHYDTAIYLFKSPPTKRTTTPMIIQPR